MWELVAQTCSIFCLIHSWSDRRQWPSNCIYFWRTVLILIDTWIKWFVVLREVKVLSHPSSPSVTMFSTWLATSLLHSVSLHVDSFLLNCSPSSPYCSMYFCVCNGVNHIEFSILVAVQNSWFIHSNYNVWICTAQFFLFWFAIALVLAHDGTSRTVTIV